MFWFENTVVKSARTSPSRHVTRPSCPARCSHDVQYAPPPAWPTEPVWCQWLSPRHYSWTRYTHDCVRLRITTHPRQPAQRATFPCSFLLHSVTTTTTTTTTYAPINLPPLAPPPAIRDPKLYPLLEAPLPRSLRKFPLTFPGGARAMFQDPTYSDDEAEAGWVEDEVPSGDGWQQLNHGSVLRDKEAVVGLPDALDRFSVRKRVHSDSGRLSPQEDVALGDVVMGAVDDPARSPPPRKKARASEAAPITSSTSRSNGGPPSPLPSPQPSPASAVLWTPNPSPPSQAAPPFQPDLSVTALLALPDVLNQYVSLPQSLQAHYLFTLLRHSPLPVLRTIHSVLTPTLARDFVGMLPPELASYILQFLPPAALFSAAKVSRSWRNLIDTDPVIWMTLLRRTGTWFGGSSEVSFARKVEEYRERHPPPRLSGGRLNMSPPHPYKLLFKSRRTVHSRWTQKTPKRLTFAAHGASVVTCLLFSRRRIISASDDHSIHIYDPVTGSQLKMLEGHDGGVWALAVCTRRILTADRSAPAQYHDVLVSGSTDRTVRIWDLSTGRNTHVFGGHTSTVRCLAIVRPTWIEREDGSGILEKWPKRTLIVTGSRDHSLRIWRLPGRHDDEYRCKGADPEDDPAEVSFLVILLMYPILIHSPTGGRSSKSVPSEVIRRARTRCPSLGSPLPYARIWKLRCYCARLGHHYGRMQVHSLGPHTERFVLSTVFSPRSTLTCRLQSTVLS